MRDVPTRVVFNVEARHPSWGALGLPLRERVLASRLTFSAATVDLVTTPIRVAASISA